MNLDRIVHRLLDSPNISQIALFALIMTSVWLVEKSVLAQSTREKWRHTWINSLFVLSALPIQILMMTFSVGLAKWTTEDRWGLVYQLPHAENPFIKYGLMFVALDFLDYIYHLTMHRVPAFWRFHLVHHSDRTVDVSTTVREHPCETVIRNAFLIVWVFLCGASAEILVVRQTVETVANLFAHTSLRLPPRLASIAGWLFITPNLHHAHHHCNLPATNCNYGDVFSVWDRLFGTFVDLARDDTVFGLDTHMNGEVEARLLRMLGLAAAGTKVRPPREIRRHCADFSYRASSWKTPRRGNMGATRSSE